jgi:hypothetical protein
VSNFNRNHLVTVFHCTDCGTPLNLSYEPKESANKTALRNQVDGITGASKVENHLYIEPCRKCIGDARKPLQQMREALAALDKESE